MMDVIILIFAIMAAVFDIKHRIVPNALIIYMFGIWLLIMVTLLCIDTSMAIPKLLDCVFGSLLGGGIFMTVYIISHRGLGGGDVKFMAAAGLYMGLQGTLSSILYGTVLAALAAITLMILRKVTRKDKMPLCPFLLAGIAITILLT